MDDYGDKTVFTKGDAEKPSEAEDSLTRILEFIREHPGATPADIRNAVPKAEVGHYGNHVNIKNSIDVLKLRGLIENRGPKGPGQGPGQWYAIEGNPESLYLQRKYGKLRGYFHPRLYPETTGFNKEGGNFWIGFDNDEAQADGTIQIDLTVPAEHSPTQNTYATIQVHYDGIAVIRELERLGFLKMFEEIQASTFYDLVQCFARCDISIMYHGEYTKEMTPRKLYEILYGEEKPN